MPIPLIIDTDPGVDDTVALVLALQSPEADVRAVTVSFGNVGIEKTFANARRVLALAGRPDIPVAAGAARPLVHEQEEWAPEWHGADGLGGRSAEFPEPVAADPRFAVALMADVLREATEPVTIISIGPLTNTALLLATHPDMTAKIGRIVAMAGSLGAGNTRGVAEFNVYADPEAAHRVLNQADVPVTMVPLDITMRTLADGDWISELTASGPRCATLAGVIAGYRKAFNERYGIDAVALHDALAVLEAVLPGTLRTTALPIRVACDLGPARGATVADRRPDAAGPPVHVALDADTDAVLAEMARRLRTLR
ncbi:nucleoside hydrolase [Pseudonocardia acidicola]|uniref:Nucleoside hydrolase n=1 Tax=Pseudonocardia acidicola TaxID=2724939 RepID=A0ABX1SGL5_9PSEU|nr:nucleoside hydrolase [Pseudonocardia acidicola]NMI00706.1 nucleoside hydrolase [Pseudonocardia acidicola]